MRKLILFLLIIPCSLFAQNIRWAKDGNSYSRIESGEINQYMLPSQAKNTFLSKADLTPTGQEKPLSPRNFSVSEDGNQILIFTNTKRVWRLDTQGDYWIYNKANKSWHKLGEICLLPPCASLKSLRMERRLLT